MSSLGDNDDIEPYPGWAWVAIGATVLAWVFLLTAPPWHEILVWTGALLVILGVGGP